ncbi:MAG: amino acid adenylation domain-containing protein [Cyanosarcina radialis HA8281-LM2]|jgi:amino acid adenylation domain-containing protein/thioester reductase-like protein|nr:amino acid adenylation domain-containing protein [Cyanosarcina radialis HA8281-LM2]
MSNLFADDNDQNPLLPTETASSKIALELPELLQHWNNTKVDYSSALGIHQLFEDRVRRNPEKIAITFEGQQLTYRELNHQANQLAHYLQTLGVESEVLVGICVERSLWMVVGLLGILKAGGAYVPLDPAFPQDRLALMVEDAQLPVLVTEKNLLAALPEHRAQVVCLDTDAEAIAQHSQTNPHSYVTPDNLAYTIYTSGSTGKPKGVQVLHRGVVNFLTSMSVAPGLTAEDILLAVTTISFDIAALELYLPLSVGAQVHLVSREVASDAARLSQAIEESGATVLQATPATWRMLLAGGWQGNSSLKILCGGEAMSRDLADKLLDKTAAVWNMYGPTETTIWSTVHQVTPGEGPISVGRPIANTQVYIVDPELQRHDDPLNILPVGEAGELLIGGVGLARGYLNRPELNEEKFLPDPFSAELGARLYRTGDLARYLPDGTIQCVGRIDHQVKIRGFRIELGDIEATLSQYPGVREAVVVGHKDNSGEQSLAAYVIPETEDNLTEKTQQWQQIWNQAYSYTPSSDDRTFNTSGWNNSYTGLPTSEEEMADWVDRTVDRILSFQPERILEIGCGTGLLLFRLVDCCDHYVGTDIAEEAIRYIEDNLDDSNRDRVSLHCCAADNLAGIETGAFDTVVINSVIQYFPDMDYLVKVLTEIARVVKPGGRIFVGDVRSLPLMKAFHTSVQLHQAPDALPASELQQRIQEKIDREQQMYIAPEFFLALQEDIPAISQVHTLLKRGNVESELNRFRYDAILEIGTTGYAPNAPVWLNWQQLGLNLNILRQHLAATQPELLGITRIPNARTCVDVKAVKLLQNDAVQTAGELREIVSRTVGIDPEDLWSLSQELSYNLYISEAAGATEGYYDIVLQRPEADGHAAIPSFPTKVWSCLPWSSYANTIEPASILPTKATTNLGSQLRTFLKEKLPAYMVPSAFVTMAAFPLTPNGKVDRRALPAPNQDRPILDSEFIAPRTSIEQKLAQIWTQVLGIEQIGVNDNFFDLGGHSLLTAQLLSHIRDTFEVELPLIALFQAPTVAGLAAAITNVQNSDAEIATAPEFQADAVLDPSIVVDVPYVESDREPQDIFLTGGTGFLGAFLLHELLNQTTATIYCLVRAKTPAAAIQKLRLNFQQYLLPSDRLEQRVVPVLGDLAQPLLGISQEQFTELAANIDTIYHNGAFVNLTYPYAALRAANVLGTQEILKLASRDRVKPVHFISTLDVFQSPHYAQMASIREDDDLGDGVGITEGYAQSKWVGEKLMMAAREIGIPTSIYRPGMITGHSQTGASQTNDLVCRLIKGLIQLGTAPTLDVKMSLTPVGYVSRAIVHLSRQSNSLGKAFHLVNPHAVAFRRFVQEIRSFGYPVEWTNYQQWQEMLKTASAQKDNALSPLLFLFTDWNSENYFETASLGSQSFDYHNTLAGLAASNIACPTVDSRLLRTYLSYLIQRGFLVAPSDEVESSVETRELAIAIA